MCGIAGFIDPSAVSDATTIDSMIARFAYRGPDGAGRRLFPEDGVALGHRRLKIIDVSDAGKQPMSSSDGRFWITYNGEIYNYVEIRRELVALGYAFHSGTDTEVLLKAYEQWGRACLERFMGMYAFALWDRENKELFAARDRLGIKPFYYQATSDGRLFFASEVKSILAASRHQRGVDTSLIDSYMEFGYVPGAQTMHAGIERLLPGHSLVWRDKRVTVSPYWDLSFDSQQDKGAAVHAEEVRDRLKESVRLHLRSDVPLGVFLSGGVDSSAVVALLSEGASSGLKTFSIAYNFGPEFDEIPYARAVSERFSTDHHAIRLNPKEFGDSVSSHIWHMDEPVADAAAISLYHVSKVAREQVTVVLSGEGSDELFAGYDFYRYNLILRRGRRLLGGATFRSLAALLPPMRRLAKLRKYIRLASEPLEKRYRGISTYDRNVKEELYSSSFSGIAALGNAQCSAFIDGLFRRTEASDPLSRMLYFDCKTWLVDDLLIKADRMSMASSLELRVPFLDHRLVEYAASTPSKYKIRGKTSKYVLKEALKHDLPREIITRKKMGFPTPLSIMLRGELFDYAHETLLSTTASNRGYFNPGAVRRLLEDHRRGKAQNHVQIWQLLVLEEWHRNFSY